MTGGFFCHPKMTSESPLQPENSAMLLPPPKGWLPAKLARLLSEENCASCLGRRRLPEGNFRRIKAPESSEVPEGSPKLLFQVPLRRVAPFREVRLSFASPKIGSRWRGCFQSSLRRTIPFGRVRFQVRSRRTALLAGLASLHPEG